MEKRNLRIRTIQKRLRDINKLDDYSAHFENIVSYTLVKKITGEIIAKFHKTKLLEDWELNFLTKLANLVNTTKTYKD